MSEIVEHSNNDGQRGDVVRVGDSHSPVSIKVYQDIYHQVTGRTEQIRRRTFDNLLVDFGSLEQLHLKITQLCDVHRVIARNESISIFHSKERKEEFTSFERFRAYNANTANPCVSVILKYNFSLIPAGLDNPQEYVVTIRLTSKVALIEQVYEEASPIMRGAYFGFAHESTAEAAIDYVDYVIARGFTEAFDEWLEGCNKTPDSGILNFCRRYSHHVPMIIRIGIAVILVMASLRAIATLDETGAQAADWARLGAFSFGFAFVLLSLVT